jgi:hypothetical protein
MRPADHSNRFIIPLIPSEFQGMMHTYIFVLSSSYIAGGSITAPLADRASGP